MFETSSLCVVPLRAPRAGSEAARVLMDVFFVLKKFYPGWVPVCMHRVEEADILLSTEACVGLNY